MAKEGNGQVILPRLVGDATSGLIRVEGIVPDVSVPVWVACHRDLSGSEKLRAIMDAIEKLFVPHQSALLGEAVSG